MTKQSILLLLAMGSLMSGLARAYCPGADPSQPGYDPDYYSVSNEMARSRYVIVGRVISETWLGEDGKPKALQPPFQDGRPRPWGFDPYSGALYDVQVVRVVKGEPGSRVTLFSENSNVRFWPDIGSEYLFFIKEATYDEPIGQVFTIDTCGNSTDASNTEEVLKGLTVSNGDK